MSGVFVQYYKDDVLITLPEEVTAVTDKNAWHFYMDTSGKVYETYAVNDICHDASSYSFYIKDTEERVGSATYGGRYHMFPISEWTVKELIKEYGHRTVLPFIGVFGTSKSAYVKMPEYGEEIYRMAEAGMCQKLYFVAGFKDFLPCEYQVEKDKDGHISFVISANGQEVYRMEIGWSIEKPSFDDYQDQIKHPWNIDKINTSWYAGDDEDDYDEVDDEDDVDYYEEEEDH